jgi:hypothetical protein
LLIADRGAPLRNPGASMPTADRTSEDRFRPGQSGNPAGRPVGSRNKATLAAEALLDGEAEKLTTSRRRSSNGG